MILNSAHLLLYKIMIYSFLSLPFWPGSETLLKRKSFLGLAMFALNIDALVQHSEVIAIDLPGFGRSSRPVFRNS